MIKFKKPTNLNGTQLLEQLNAAGVEIINPPFIDGNSDLWLDIASKDKSKAEPVVAAHNGNIIAPEPTVEQKLASVGLNLDDLKVALGI